MCVRVCITPVIINWWICMCCVIYMQIPLKTEFGITMSPSNGMYLRVVSR